MSSISPVYGPLGRVSPGRDISELFKRVEDLERTRSGGADFRLVWGAVLNDAGVIDAGSGDWTIAWEDDDASSPGLNFYTITFATPFSGDDPVVLLTGNNDTFTGGDTGAYTVTLLRRANDHIVVYTHNIDDPDSLSDQDGGFDFAIIGAA